ncbi:Acetyl-coenzyme A synthetase [Thalassovita gelatinovora]|uniref:Acetyl-coenzyme A synthetase n=1 Tax=Thalassovita gelatinovora TaxID=53501 RepID=A0A0N7LVQ4_THAGE|nr:AMP-binding protein [Thalassovita gelatinovora]QIZ79851.1 AMP-binding protein [Thalassovita gelatinovora]CUH66946.1 Acetyl-coenzyme A synthetase [Thalassovita gelatinovora]SEQ45499.1 acetyl-CoA synthetase [Thalassovita gelatinovora]
MLPHVDSYGALIRGFRWDIPARLNMAVQVCDDWAARAPDRVAIIDMTGGTRQTVSYGRLRQMADGLAHDMVRRGVQRGDRVGVLRSQSPWTAAAHIACWKLGAISIPLFKLFGTEALITRLQDAGVDLVIADPEGTEGLAEWLKGAGQQSLIPEHCDLSDTRFDTVQTGPEDAAVLIYTSGTTGAPKGALHGHRMLIGHLPGVEISHDFLGQPDDCLWTPADWAWIGGLFDVLMPGLALGVPVIAARLDKFTVADCQRIVDMAGVKNIFFPPTALRMLKAEDAAIAGLRSVASGGEPLGAEMLDWGRRAFGLQINEFYGQTECNMVASSCAALFSPKPGCLGKPAPGFDIAVLDADGNPTDGEGDIAIRKGAASMMLGYWNRPEETAEKFIGDWMLTGDRGTWDGDFLRFVGREDDVITSAGYRIGPSEIEDGLLKHASVATVGVVGKPDALRTEIVKAYVVLKPGFDPSDALARDLQDFAKTRVAKHSYPREIAFLDALPMTVTGKVIRKELKARAARETEGDT